MQQTIEVNRNKTYIIRSFKDKDVALRMLSMGILPGQSLRILARSPFGRSYYISVGRQWIAVRAEELSAIEWQEMQASERED